jgi:hypothetical protein
MNVCPSLNSLTSRATRSREFLTFFATVVSALLLTACGALPGLLGAGVGTAIKQEKENESAETFTYSLQRTKSALLVGLKRMAIEVTSVSPTEKGEKITGKTKEHSVDIELTPVTDKATRMIVKVGRGLKADRATAEEVVQQTQRALKTEMAK